MGTFASASARGLGLAHAREDALGRRSEDDERVELARRHRAATLLELHHRVKLRIERTHLASDGLHSLPSAGEDRPVVVVVRRRPEPRDPQDLILATTAAAGGQGQRYYP